MPEFIDFSKVTTHQLGVAEPAITFEQAYSNVLLSAESAAVAVKNQQKSMQELIDEAKLRLAAGGTKKVDGAKVPTVEAADAALVKQLHALAAEAKTTRDEAGKQYDAIKAVLADLAGEENEVLTVNGVPIFTNKRSTVTILNQAAIKEAFPQAEHPEFYDTQERRTKLLK